MRDNSAGTINYRPTSACDHYSLASNNVSLSAALFFFSFSRLLANKSSRLVKHLVGRGERGGSRRLPGAVCFLSDATFDRKHTQPVSHPKPKCAALKLPSRRTLFILLLFFFLAFSHHDLKTRHSFLGCFLIEAFPFSFSFFSPPVQIKFPRAAWRDVTQGLCPQKTPTLSLRPTAPVGKKLLSFAPPCWNSSSRSPPTLGLGLYPTDPADLFPRSIDQSIRRPRGWKVV